jgi:hypothetical protein
MGLLNEHLVEGYNLLFKKKKTTQNGLSKRKRLKGLVGTRS